MSQLRRQRGMTLIELVIVIMIIGILAAIAVPTYRAYVVRSQRSDAKDALLALATQQEKHYLQCNNYATAIDAATDCGAGELPGADVSKNGWYQLSIPAANLTSFTVRAVAIAGESQFQDTECRRFEVTEAGLRTAFDDGGGDNTEECWE